MGRAKRQQVETIGTTTHKNKINHTQKQSGTTTHSNKKTSLKITNKTKQKWKTTHKKTTFYYLLIETMAKTQSNTWQEKEKRAKKTRKQKENGCIYSNDDSRARGLDALNRYLSKQMRGRK